MEREKHSISVLLSSLIANLGLQNKLRKCEQIASEVEEEV
jgi:hypothetical protein